jgi:histidinol-phosphate aminotransferase
MVISRRTLLSAFGTTALATAMPQTLRALSQTTSARDNVESGPRVIRLDKNENPYGPSDNVAAALRSGLENANRFPESELQALTKRIAEVHGVHLEQVILGCGSTEILSMCSRAFLGPQSKLLMSTPGFDAMAGYARTAGAYVHTVPLAKNYTHDLSAMAQQAASTGFVYISNPHNPTGTVTPRKDIESFIRALSPHTYVVIDEAYHHYVAPSSSYTSFIDHPVNDPRVIVTRTFSKIYGLAGMRIGYAIAAPQTVQRIMVYRLREEVNVSAARAARIAFEANDHVQTCAQRNTDNRQEFCNQANARMLRWIDSQANFVLLNTGRSGLEISEHFRKNNILIASGFPLMENYVRVTVGSPEEMKEFWRVWDLMPQHAMAM